MMSPDKAARGRPSDAVFIPPAQWAGQRDGSCAVRGDQGGMAGPEGCRDGSGQGRRDAWMDQASLGAAMLLGSEPG